MRHELLLKMESGEALTHEEKQEFFREMAKNTKEAEDLRRDFAITRGQLLLPMLRQQSLIRQIFREVPTGGEQVPFPIRSKRIRSAWYMSGLGSTPQRTAEMDEMYVPTFSIRGGVRWPIDLLKTGNYDFVEGLENDSMDEVIFKENLAGWTLIKAAEQSGDLLRVPQAGSTTTFSIEAMVAIITALDEQEDRRRITDIYLSPRKYNEMLKWAKLETEELDDQTRRNIFVSGPDAVSSILRNWGVAFHKVFDADFVSNLQAYCFDGTKFGVMPVDQPWETLNDDQAKMTWEAGWIGREKVGFGVIDIPSGCWYDFANA